MATGNKPGVLTSAPLPVPPIVTVNCRVEFVLLTMGNFVSLPPNNAVTVGFSVVPKKPPFTLKATGEPVPCGMLSGEVPTSRWPHRHKRQRAASRTHACNRRVDALLLHGKRQVR